jgi:Protein of unknown function (DUF4231)
MVDDISISEKVKEYLGRILTNSRTELIKLKRKKKTFQILYISTVISSIIISTAVASLTNMIAVPSIVVTLLSASSAILTGVSARFNFQNKKVEINNLIEKLHKIQAKLDHVISCNGDLTKEEYEQILKDFNF